MQGWKMQNWKMSDESTGLENAETLENHRLENGLILYL